MMPVFCSSEEGISRDNNIIVSGQTYWPYKKYPQPLDQDMSDFAVGFYEIIYKDILVDNNGEEIRILNCLDNFTDNNYEVITFSDPDKYTGEKVIENMLECMKNRARCIAESKIAEELWKYFNRLNIVQD